MSTEDDDLIETIKLRLDMCEQDDGVFNDPDEAAFLTQILARIRKLESQATWQPIETAPKDGTRVLLADSSVAADGYFDYLLNKGNGSWVWPYVKREPTHWKSMPEFPKQEKEK